MALQENHTLDHDDEGNRRADIRVSWFSRATILGVTCNSNISNAEDFLFEAGTSDVSASGASIMAPNLLHIGQPVCVRMGSIHGLAISTRGRVVRRGSPDANSKHCSWGIAFALNDIEELRRHHIFSSTGSSAKMEDDTAVLLSVNPLELLWWYSRLSKDVRTVLVGTAEQQVLDRMRKMDPTRDIRRLVS